MIKRCSCAIIMIICLTVAFNGHAQTLETIKVLERNAQKELDKGIDMRGTTKTLYSDMDSIMNVVYNKLRKTMSASEKDSLKKEQLEWLKKRDSHFKQLYKDVEKETQLSQNEWGELEYLMVYHPEVEYVKARTIVLMKRLNK